MLGVASAEFFNPPGGIHQFLLAGKKRVTGRTDLHFQLGENRSDLECTAAGALCGDGFIFGVYIFFIVLAYPPGTSLSNVHNFNKTKT